jgi:NitT/TauT family transport system ATP-binding protein
VNTDVGYMTQKDNLLPWRSVRDNVAFPLELAGVAQAERARRADEVIKHVGLQGFEDRYPNELSGGMRKRACLGACCSTAPRPRCSTSRSPRSTRSSSSRCMT